MDGYASLVTASAVFVGTHFLMSHPLRARMVAAFGNGGFLGVYSLISLATFGWMIWAFRNVPSGEVFWAPTDAIWVVASIVTLLAAVFYCGSMIGNPALPNPDSNAGSALAAKTPTGMFLVTRHPMMWSFALWGVGHILVAPRTDNFIFVGSIIFLALVGAKAQERKKRRRKWALAGAHGKCAPAIGRACRNCAKSDCGCGSPGSPCGWLPPGRIISLAPLRPDFSAGYSRTIAMPRSL